MSHLTTQLVTAQDLTVSVAEEVGQKELTSLASLVEWHLRDLHSPQTTLSFSMISKARNSVHAIVRNSVVQVAS